MIDSIGVSRELVNTVVTMEAMKCSRRSNNYEVFVREPGGAYVNSCRREPHCGT